MLPAEMLSLAASSLFAVLWLTGYEGLALDDDCYMAFAAVFLACLFGLSVVHLRRQLWESGLDPRVTGRLPGLPNRERNQS